MSYFVFHIRLKGVPYSTEYQYITRVTYSDRICRMCDIYVPCHIRFDITLLTLFLLEPKVMTSKSHRSYKNILKTEDNIQKYSRYLSFSKVKLFSPTVVLSEIVHLTSLCRLNVAMTHVATAILHRLIRLIRQNVIHLFKFMKQYAKSYHIKLT